MTFSVMTRDEDGNEIEVSGPYKSGSWARKVQKRQEPTFQGQVFFVVNHDRDWRARERTRFAKGEYIPLPFADDPIYQKNYPDHFAHFAKKNPLNVAYTANENDGRKDKKLSRSLSRYMEDFAPHIKNRQQIINDHQKTVTLKMVKFTEKPEEAVWVYNHGPRSCMNGGHWLSKVHPAEIYAGGTLRLAYVMAPDGKRASARAVVDIEKKTFVHAYGEVGGRPFNGLLKDLGFKNSGWAGATFPLILQKHGDNNYNAFVFPICDGAGGFVIKDKMVEVWDGPKKGCIANRANEGLMRVEKPFPEDLKDVRYL